MLEPGDEGDLSSRDSIAKPSGTCWCSVALMGVAFFELGDAPRMKSGDSVYVLGGTGDQAIPVKHWGRYSPP
jgi:hypothetical protein